MAKAAILLGGIVVALAAAGAQADVNVSDKPTQNMRCSAGICTATARNAILNATDLANMLASGDTTVASGSLAKDIDIRAPLSWTSSHRLTLDAFHSISFNKPVTVSGTGALTIATNDGGSGGDFRFFSRGHVVFWDTAGSLTINGQSYRLVRTLRELKRLIAHNVDGFYAISQNIGAKGHAYDTAIVADLGGTLEGLGNKISNLTIHSNGRRANVGFIGQLVPAASSGTIRDIGLVNLAITGSGAEECVGALVSLNDGTILNAFTTGSVSAGNTGLIAGRASL